MSSFKLNEFENAVWQIFCVVLEEMKAVLSTRLIARLQQKLKCA